MLLGTKVVCMAALLGLLMGCLSGGLDRNRPFSAEWTDHVKSERAFEARKKRIQQGDIPLGGDKGDSKAFIRVDEEGRPRLGLGDEQGISAEVDYDSGPEAEVKYQVEWDFVKPKRRK